MILEFARRFAFIGEISVIHDTGFFIGISAKFGQVQLRPVMSVLLELSSHWDGGGHALGQPLDCASSPWLCADADG